MRVPPLVRTVGWCLLAGLLATGSAACPAGGTGMCDGTVVQILPLADVNVTESQVVSFNVTGQGSGTISFDGEGPPGATLTQLSTLPPVASFRITAAGGACDTETVTINVQPGAGGQPKFLGAYSITVDVSAMTPFVQLEVSVQDDDTPSLALFVSPGTEIPGADLSVDVDGKTGIFSWSPTPEQIQAACTYATTFIADDGISQVAQQLFIQFRPTAQPPDVAGCGGSCPPGNPPTIATSPLGNQDHRGPFP
jgi:hypothetical protein